MARYQALKKQAGNNNLAVINKINDSSIHQFYKRINLDTNGNRSNSRLFDEGS